jgi:hypothetical protein
MQTLPISKDPQDSILLDVPVLTRNDTNPPRIARRGIVFEANKISPLLLDIDDDFIKDLFESPEEDSYKEIYNFYLERYEQRALWVKEVIKPRYTRVYDKHFVDLFKPLEG